MHHSCAVPLHTLPVFSSTICYANTQIALDRIGAPSSGVQLQLRLTTYSSVPDHEYLHTWSPPTSSQPATSSSSHNHPQAMSTHEKYFWTPKGDIKIEDYVKRVF